MTFNGRLKDHPVVSTIAERKSEEAKRIPPPKKGTKKTEVWLFSYFIFCQKKKKKEKRRSIHHIQSGVERNEWAQDTRKRNLKKKFKKKKIQTYKDGTNILGDSLRT